MAKYTYLPTYLFSTELRVAVVAKSIILVILPSISNILALKSAL